MNHRQWKKNYKKRYGYNPPAYMDKRKRRKARAQQSLPCAGISVELDNTGNGNIYRGSIYRSREYMRCIGAGI